MQCFKKFDIFSCKAEFTFNENGETRLKSPLGGLLTTFFIFLSVSISLYYSIEFFMHNNQYIISSRNSSPFLNLTQTNKIPFIFRLTDGINLPYEEPSKIYKVALKYWYGGSNESAISTKQFTNDIEVEQCNINKHFSEYKELFSEVNDIHTFYCPIIRNYNQTIYGIYGNIYPFGYYHFYFYMCLNQSSSDNCFPYEQLEKTLSNTYLEMKTIDYSVNNFNKKSIQEMHIKNERFMISNTVYKRIWLYLNAVEFTTDYGYVFKREKTERFFSYDSIRYDIDKRNIMEGTIPGTFVTMTILSSGNVMVYHKSYTKIPDFLATISGIIKLFHVICYLLNYFYSKNTYFYKLYSEYYLIEEQHKKAIDKQISNPKHSLIKIHKHKNHYLSSKKSTHHLYTTIHKPKLSSKNNKLHSTIMLNGNNYNYVTYVNKSLQYKQNEILNDSSCKHKLVQHNKTTPNDKLKFSKVQVAFPLKLWMRTKNKINYYSTVSKHINSMISYINVLNRIDKSYLISSMLYRKHNEESYFRLKGGLNGNELNLVFSQNTPTSSQAQSSIQLD